MSNPFLTVMMPCFNNAAFVGEAIRSVLSQTWTDLELLILDDCSTDHSAEIIHSHVDSRIRYVRNDVNWGISKVRNGMLALARGRYLTSLDADDVLLHPEKLATELKLAQDHQRWGQVAIGFSDIVHIDANSQPMSSRAPVPQIREGYLFQSLLDRSVMIPRDFVVSAEVARQVGGYDESLKIYEDWDYKLKLAMKAAFSFTGLQAIGYRRHGNGLSAAPAKLHRDCQDRIRAKYCVLGFQKRAWSVSSTLQRRAA